MANQVTTLKMEQKFKKTPAGEIPMDWDVVKLGDISIQPEERFVPVPGDARPYIGLEHIGSGTGRLLSTGTSTTVSSLKSIFRAGDILFGKLRPNLKKVVMPPFAGVCSTDIMVIRPKDGFSRSFMFYRLQSATAFDFAVGTSGGTKMPRTSWPLFRNYAFPCPHLAEQKKIAEILSTVDDAIEKTRAGIEKSNQLKKGLMQTLLTRGIGHKKFKKSPAGEIPVEWELLTLGKISEIRRGASPRPIGDPKFFGNGRGWVRIADVTRSTKFLRTTEQQLSHLGEAGSVKVDHGDIIMSICATIGKPIIVDMEACIHDGFVLFEKLSPRILKEFLYYFLQWKENYLAGKGQPGAQKNLNTTIVGETEIPLPPISQQKYIAEILSAVDMEIEKQESARIILQRLKKSLMQVLLTGRLRI